MKSAEFALSFVPFHQYILSIFKIYLNLTSDHHTNFALHDLASIIFFFFTSLPSTLSIILCTNYIGLLAAPKIS